MKKIAVLIIVLALSAFALISCSGETAPETAANTPLPQDVPVTAAIPAEPVETYVVAPETTPSAETAPETEAQTAEGSGKEASSTTEAIVALAQKLIGTQFKMGGAGPEEFDNSGFVYYVYRQNGINVPRLAVEMVNYGKTVTRAEMLPGDIAVFANEIDGPAAFVGVYVGDGKFIACNNPDSPTKVQNMDSNYWTPRFISGRRVA